MFYCFFLNSQQQQFVYSTFETPLVIHAQFLGNVLHFSTPIDIAIFEQRVVGGEVTMPCPIQSPNEKVGEWSWYKYDSSIKEKVTMIKANVSFMDPNVTSLNQPRVTRTISQDGTLTLRGLQLNDTGVYECQINTGNQNEIGYIKLTVNGKFNINDKRYDCIYIQDYTNVVVVIRFVLYGKWFP